jgi:hypothetical protein
VLFLLSVVTSTLPPSSTLTYSEPHKFEDAVDSPGSQHWRVAMDVEMDSLSKREVFELGDLPPHSQGSMVVQEQAQAGPLDRPLQGLPRHSRVLATARPQVVPRYNVVLVRNAIQGPDLGLQGYNFYRVQLFFSFIYHRRRLDLCLGNWVNKVHPTSCILRHLLTLIMLHCRSTKAVLIMSCSNLLSR